MVTVLPAAAQQPLRIVPPTADQPSTASEKATRERELERVRAEQRQASENEARLAAEISALGQDRGRLTRSLIDTAGRLQELEAKVAGAEARLRELDGREGGIRTALDARRATIAELLAALQRIGRRPPPALLVKPEDALEAVRSAIMLGAVVPEMRGEAESLARDLAALARIRSDMAAERAGMAAELARLADERQRMTLLVEERQKRQAEAEKALEGERQRAVQLARQAETLRDLVAKLEQDAALTTRSLPPATERRPETPRLSPAIAFAAAKGALPLPVRGLKTRDFGAPDGLGGSEKGVSVVTRAGAQVTAPCDGAVVYAGPFRSYGQLLILNAGGGYHVLLAGMERISVDLGQFVLTGEPVAVMGGEAKLAAATATSGASQPVLYIEFRKDGTPIDPAPWWANTHSEKVRG